MDFSPNASPIGVRACGPQLHFRRDVHETATQERSHREAGALFIFPNHLLFVEMVHDLAMVSCSIVRAAGDCPLARLFLL